MVTITRHKFSEESFLGIEFTRKLNHQNRFDIFIVNLLRSDQLIFHHELENFTNIFWTSQKLNKYFSKELGEIYESKYLYL